MSTKVTKLHASERLLKARYFALRDALTQIAHCAPHTGNTKDHCAGNCPVCCADRALAADAAHGRITDDRPREERE